MLSVLALSRISDIYLRNINRFNLKKFIKNLIIKSYNVFIENTKNYFKYIKIKYII